MSAKNVGNVPGNVLGKNSGLVTKYQPVASRRHWFSRAQRASQMIVASQNGPAHQASAIAGKQMAFPVISSEPSKDN